jgi:signal transduction histidine kinase
MQKKLAQPLESLNANTLREGVSIINERADSLSAFISSYSQLSHLPEPNKKIVPLIALIQGLVPLFTEGRVVVDASCDIELDVDKSQVEQVLINVFKNGFEAMANISDKEVRVCCFQEGKWQHIIVSDQGMGIANSDNLFVPFYSTKPQGSGIGLALCKQILFNHNGLISLKNKNVGTGVEAIISLPKRW